MLTFGSLFSGVGGLDYGFERAGLQCKWQCEINDFRNRVLERHWPGLPRWRDICDFQPGPEHAVDIIAGGFPCKQTSTGAAVHGKRKGLAGRHSGLWYEMLRVVRIVRPRIVVVENVGGAAVYQNEITSGLAAAGYVVPDEPISLSSEMFGAPYLRRRLFWIADFDGAGLEIARQAKSFAAERVTRRTTDGNNWLATLAGIRGMDDGISGGIYRRERIEGCGDSVSPIVAQWIGERILAAALTDMSDESMHTVKESDDGEV
jgi:DNA (cytosine-5)-methyltransferase 1